MFAKFLRGCMPVFVSPIFGQCMAVFSWDRFFPAYFFFAECVMEVSVSDITSDAFVIPWDLHGFF